MAIHFLNCLTIRPYFPTVVGGVTCLLVETNQGLVLVDAGVGTRDYESKGLMRLFLKAMRSRFDVNETALHQVQRLGFKPKDVRHIIITHAHLDHAGGLPDFPAAKVHVFKPEYDYILNRPGPGFIRRHWAHGPKWVVHELGGGKWYDFDAIRLQGFEPEMWLVPLTGHTPGLCGVAIRKDAGCAAGFVPAALRSGGTKPPGWILYASDAVPFDVRVDEVPDWISRLFIGPHVPRIRAFMKTHSEVQVVGAHMRPEFYEGA